MEKGWKVGHTCERTTTPSLVRCVSVSSASAPASIAPLKAAMVFSGNRALNPRCAIACGSLLPLFDFLAKHHGANQIVSCVFAACEQGGSYVKTGVLWTLLESLPPTIASTSHRAGRLVVALEHARAKVSPPPGLLSLVEQSCFDVRSE